MDRIKKNIQQSLQKKLTVPVVLTVSIVFLVMLFIMIKYYTESFKQQVIESHKAQVWQATVTLSMTQSMIENIARQIVVSDVVQNDIGSGETIAKNSYIADLTVKNELRTYTNVISYIQEIMILTDTNDTYSSMRLRDKFDPEQESWYQDFIAGERTEGFTEVHLSSPTQDGRSKKVLSYILTYYSVENYRKKLGELIISLDHSYLESLVALDMTFLAGYVVYNENGHVIIENGDIDVDYETIGERDEQFTDSSGNLYLISRNMKGDIITVVEISNQLLRQRIVGVVLFLVFIFVGLIILIVQILSTRINKVVWPINRLCEAASKVGDGNMDISVDVTTGDEIEVLANVFNKMVKDVKHYTQMSVKHEKVMRQSQIDQLLLQINPHFIYNTLNSIVYMAQTEGNKEIIQFTNAFISLLQSTLQSEKAIFIPLEKELKNVESYIVLQEFRYRDRFEKKIECEKHLAGYMVPQVILQPIVENAIFHGIGPMDGKGQLMIQVKQEDNNVLIIVEDNGVGMPQEIAKEALTKHRKSQNGMRKIGVANVYYRVKQIYGESSTFIIESTVGVGTRVTITLPIGKNQMKEVEYE